MQLCIFNDTASGRLLPGPALSLPFKTFVRTVLPTVQLRVKCVAKAFCPAQWAFPVALPGIGSILRCLQWHLCRAIERLASSPKPCCMRCTGWWKAELPFVGEYSTENVGRTPNAVDLK